MASAWRALVLLSGAAVIAILVALMVDIAARAAMRSDDSIIGVVRRYCRRPMTATLTAIAVLASIPTAGLGAGGRSRVHHVFVLALIGSVAWLVSKVLFVLQDLAFAHTRVDVRDNRRARRVRTQVAIVRRLTAASVALIAGCAMLMTFGTFRTFGASLLASAGLVGVVAGVASQSALTNVIAGVQLAFTDALRIDDVVVVEDEWGRVENLALMNVTLHLWDERRLILPTSYFTTNPFQNWTRMESRVVGSVLLHVDFSAPLDDLRSKTYDIVRNSPLWDQRDWAVQVVDSTPSTMVLRILASAADASSAWDLRCDIREGLLGWLHDDHPEALPRVRGDLASLTIEPERKTTLTRR